MNQRPATDRSEELYQLLARGVHDGLITEEEALKIVESRHLSLEQIERLMPLPIAESITDFTEQEVRAAKEALEKFRQNGRIVWQV